MKEDFYFLRTKAEKFMEMADVAFEKGHYDLCSLNLEQAVQLFLKFTIGITLGNFPHTHDIEKLMRTLDESFPELKIKKLLVTESDIIKDIYKSYFDSRYFDEPFTKSQVEKMKKFVHRLKIILKKKWN